MIITNKEQLVYEVKRLSVIAGKVILGYYDNDITVEQKKDKSPVTLADIAAEKVILDGLKKLTPDIPMIAEESVASGKIPSIGNQPFWLIDPLDGTREFISRNGEFTVNIALIEEGRPTLGVVHIPAKELSFYTSGLSKAHCRSAEKDEIIEVRTPGIDGYVVVASRSHRDPRTDEWLKSINVKSFTAAGSSLKFCLVAMGAADLYPRLGRTMEWDTAAGHAVLASAGGSVRTLDGKDLHYGKPGFENPYFIARGKY